MKKAIVKKDLRIRCSQSLDENYHLKNAMTLPYITRHPAKELQLRQSQSHTLDCINNLQLKPNQFMKNTQTVSSSLLSFKYEVGSGTSCGLNQKG